MKTIKQIREEYDSVMVHDAPDELMLEGRESVAMKAAERAVPLPSQMPTMLMFRRVAYRQYPGKQVVALYYSKLVNKYLSIPFGPDGNLNLSEAVVLDEGAGLEAVKGGLKGAAKGAFKGHLFGAAVAGGPGAALGTVAGGAVGAYKGAKKAYNKAKEQGMEEDWSDAKYKNPEGGLTKAGVMKYRSEHPGSKLQTAVTTKPSKLKKGSKAANRRKSFCARMGGMKKRLTSAKTARDPDSRINKALRKWNCEESFRQKLEEKRQLRENPAVIGALRVAAPYVARGAGAAAGLALKGGKALVRGGKAALRGLAGLATSAAAGAAAGSAAAGSKGDSDSSPAIERRKGQLLRDKPGSQTTSSWKTAKTSDDTFQSRYKASLSKEFSSSPQRQVAENKISDIKNMLNENIETMDLSINGRTVTLNNSMAKKIVRVYESVNTKNKKIVESMLNEDLDSFKKLLNFSIKA